MKKIDMMSMIIVIFLIWFSHDVSAYNECSYYDHSVPCTLPGSSSIILDSVMGNAAGMVGYFVGSCYEETDWYQNGELYADLHALENPIPEGCAYYHVSKSYVWLNSNSIFGGFGGANFLKDSGFFWVNANANTMCNFPQYCSFPDFQSTGLSISGEYVYRMDAFQGVPSYLNSKSDGSGSSSFYQCTEYAARYLHRKFGTDYTDIKNINDSNTQGFRGFDFHPNYGGNPPVPSVDKNGHTISLVRVTTPQSGDVAIFTFGHTAVVKSVSGSTATLIEQNYIINGKYTISRYVNTSTPGLYFFRFNEVVIQGKDTPYTSIQEAYNSISSDGQSLLTQAQIFTEDVNFSNNLTISLKGGYDSSFSSNTGWTTINGSLTLSGGTVELEGMCIQ